MRIAKERTFEDLFLLPNNLKCHLIKLINNFNGFDNLSNFKFLLNSNLIKLDCLHTKFKDETFKDISNKCPKLEFLRFAVDSDNPPTSETFCSNLKKLPGLIHFYVINCSTINDQVVQTLTESCPNMRSLALRGCNVTNLGMKYLKNLPLSFLDIRLNPKIDLDGLNEFDDKSVIAENLSDLFVSNLALVDYSKFKKLKHFSFVCL